MTRVPWWIPVLATGVAHAAFLVVPLSFDGPPKRAERPVVLRFKTPPPEPEPEPEPELPEPPPEPMLPEPEPPSEPEPPPEPPPERPQPPPEPQAEPEPEPPAQPPSEPVAEAEPAPKPEPALEPPPAPEPPVPVQPKARPPKPPSPTPQPGPSKADFGAYAQGMRTAFLRHRRYPPAALRARLEGVTKVKLAVDRRGKLVGEPKVVSSSGHRVLDEEALRVVTVSAPFDPLPSGTPKDVMTFVIPIDFHLQAGR